MKDFEVALTKCYFCGEGSTIVMNSRLTRGAAAKVKELHNKVVDMTPCSKCAAFMKQGVILIGIDNSKSTPGWSMKPSGDDRWIPNPYRTGQFFVVSDDYIKRIVNDERMLSHALKHRFMFIEEEALIALGFLDENKNLTDAVKNPQEETEKVSGD